MVKSLPCSSALRRWISLQFSLIHRPTIGLHLERLITLVRGSHATQERHENDPKTVRYAYISKVCCMGGD